MLCPLTLVRGIPPSRSWSDAKSNPLIRDSLRPGEEKMSGVMCGIDAVGYQARSFGSPKKENPIQVLDSLAKIINPTGNLGIVGVYTAEDPHGVNKKAKEGTLDLPLGRTLRKRHCTWYRAMSRKEVQSLSSRPDHCRTS